MSREDPKPEDKPLLELDVRVGELFRPYTGTPLVRILGVLSKLGDQPELRIIACGLIAGGAFLDNQRLVRAGTRMIIAHEAATFAKDLVKANIDRTRPRTADTLEAKKPTQGNHTSKERTSFPSGHSAGAIAAARAFSREFTEYGTFAIGSAALIAALQVVRCAHYPSDVAAGVLMGLAAEAGTSVAWTAEVDK